MPRIKNPKKQRPKTITAGSSVSSKIFINKKEVPHIRLRTIKAPYNLLIPIPPVFLKMCLIIVHFLRGSFHKPAAKPLDAFKLHFYMCTFIISKTVNLLFKIVNLLTGQVFPSLPMKFLIDSSYNSGI